jgi:NADPH-dependent 2,4-dienoyl-CoA reductase/sulfur reductase-like enzyme
LKVSEIAALRGHQVILLEKDDKLGGQILLASKLPHRDQVHGVISHLIKRVNRLGVEIYYNMEADEKTVLDFNPDAVVIATGSRVLPLDIPGGNQENVYSVYDVIDGKATVGNRVLFIDQNGHYKGAGVAELLASQGAHVNIVTHLSFVGENLEPSNQVMFYQRFMEMDVEMTPHHEVEAIKGNRAVLKNVYTEKEIEIDGYDSFIYATQNSSITDLYFSLKGKCKEIYRIGDSAAPRMIEQAVWDGEEIGRKL